MNLMLFNKHHILWSFSNICRAWQRDNRANVVIETAFIFPILIVMLMGTMDIGRGLLVNKKVVSAANIAADLIGREESLTDDELNNYIEAAQLAMDPYALGSFGIDVAGIRFVNASADPEVQWRDTVNMPINASVEADADGLGSENEGVVAVTVTYSFTPQFSNIITGTIDMQETAFVRGRITSFVRRE